MDCLNKSNMILHLIDAYSFIIIGPFSIVSTLIAMGAFLFSEKVRRQPGSDILFSISISDFLVTCHLVSHSLYKFINKSQPEDDEPFCQCSTYISSIGTLSQYYYNFIFCLYLYVKIKGSLFNRSLKAIYYHFIALIIIIVWFFIHYYYYINGGVNIFGLCSYQIDEQLAYVKLSLTFLVGIFYWFVILYFGAKSKGFRSKNNTIKMNNSKQSSYMKYYLSYIAFLSIIWTVLTTSYFLINLICKDLISNRYMVMVTVGNISQVCQPFLMGWIRLNDPLIIKLMKRRLRTYSSCNNDSASAAHLSDNIDIIVQRDKEIQLFTYFVGMSIAINQYLSKQIQINDSFFKSEFSFTYPPEFLENNVVNECTLNILAPEFFHRQRQRDKCDFLHSLDIRENIQEIFGKGEGKSGAFIMHTHDKKLVIKSQTNDEIQYMTSIMTQYKDYVITNKETLIAPIFGIFTFVPKNNILMTFSYSIQRNLLIIPKSYLLRVYDLKGSTLGRQTFKKSYLPNRDEMTRTMKDLDFQRFETKIYVSNEASEKLRVQIRKDSRFLQQQQLIDYSLLIFIVDLGKYCQDNMITIQQYLKRVNDLQECYIHASSTEPGVYYIMGIIDYLQIYDGRKIAERFSKNLTHFDLQGKKASCQDPKTYSKKFIKNICDNYLVYDKVNSMYSSGIDIEKFNLSIDFSVISEQNEELSIDKII